MSDQVLATTLYLRICSIYPPDTDIASILPSPSSNLRALYVGLPAPELAAQSICQFSLYADEILVTNPFPIPWFLSREYSPLRHPELYLQSTLRMLGFINAVSPWIAKGLVTLVPNPGHFDVRLLHETSKAAHERLGHISSEDVNLDDPALLSSETQKRLLLTMPRQYLESVVSKTSPDLSPAEVDELLDDIEAMRKNDPYTLPQDIGDSGGQLEIFDLGGSLEMTLLVARMAGAFPYTNINFKWREIQHSQGELSDSAKIWTPLTRAFQNLEFEFLNNVDSDFAANLRGDGRLESFRQFLRKVWQAASSDENNEESIREFCDELTDAHRKAQAEWVDIDRRLVHHSAGSVVGGLSLGLAGWPTIAALVAALLNSRMKRSQFAKTNPMSVFIDLERKSKR